MIYRARATFPALLERAGLRQSAVARRAAMSRIFLSHVAAGRRHNNGVLAARIDQAYAAVAIDQATAIDRLLAPVADKKHAGARRERGARGTGALCEAR